jgi:hypothetical protein
MAADPDDGDAGHFSRTYMTALIRRQRPYSYTASAAWADEAEIGITALKGGLA